MGAYLIDQSRHEGWSEYTVGSPLSAYSQEDLKLPAHFDIPACQKIHLSAKFSSTSYTWGSNFNIHNFMIISELPTAKQANLIN